MPGAWELDRVASVLCVVLHTEHTTIPWAFGLRELEIPGPVVGVSGMPFDHARNAGAMMCLDGGFDWLFFLDSDVVPPWDAVPRLMKHRLPIVSGMYCRRSPPAGVPVMMRQGQWVTGGFKPGDLVEVETVGAGCLLIHNSVLRALPPQRPGKHWFDWRVDMVSIQDGKPPQSEDFTFCLHAKNHGYKVYVDSSVQCRHLGYSEATHNKLTVMSNPAAVRGNRYGLAG